MVGSHSRGELRAAGGKAGGANKRQPVTAVTAAAAKLRELILEQPSGTLLGSEDDLLMRLQVSRPTFRQASQALISEQLLTIRRGVGGGYFTRSPSVDAIVHMASIYLYKSQANVHDMMDVAGLLITRAVTSACANPDPGQRARVAALVDSCPAEISEANLSEINQLMLDLASLIGHLSGNPMLAMYIDIAMDITVPQRTQRILTPRRARGYLDLAQELAHYIAIGEAEFATIIYGRMTLMVRGWWEEDSVQ